MACYYSYVHFPLGFVTIYNFTFKINKDIFSKLKLGDSLFFFANNCKGSCYQK